MSRANGTSPAKADDAPGQAWVSVRPTWRLSTLTPALFNAQEYRFQPINLPGEPTWKPSGCAGAPGACSVPKASLYYPGMRNRADALVINLATDEKRDDIDFTIPPP